jgi:hypothetical protein
MQSTWSKGDGLIFSMKEVVYERTSPTDKEIYLWAYSREIIATLVMSQVVKNPCPNR